MRFIVLITMLSILCSLPVSAQISIPTRNLHFQALDDDRKLLWIDYHEGLLMPCDTMYFEDSLAVGLFGKRWNIYFDFFDAGIVNLIPVGQNIDSWSENITVMRIDTEGIPASKFHKKLRQSREKDNKCPGKIKNENVIQDSRNLVLIELEMGSCGNEPPQTEISKFMSPPKLVLLQYTIWVVMHTKTDGSPGSASRAEVLNWLNAVELISGKELKKYTRSD